jgi:hypothetical protein
MIVAQFLRRGMTRAGLSAGLALAFIAGCSDNPAKPIEGAGDPENISTVTVKLVSGSTTVQSVRRDPDGSTLPQPVGAAQGTLTLTKGVTYTGTITLLNDLDPNNVVDITAEVKKENDFHQFFYTFELTGGGTCSGISVPASSMDVDSKGLPVGLTFQVAVTAGAASTTSCNMRVNLHHWESGDKTSTVFDTDLDLTFPLTIS